jgi:heterotetrameric sarcosine oxidase delta subunit
MGFRLDCPRCGPRSYREFLFGGELRPNDEDMTDEQDYEATWLRSNVLGPQRESWFHWAGCKRWMTVHRDTSDNAILTDESLEAHP